MTATIDQNPKTVPGALERELRREVPGVGVIEFESAPAGWLMPGGDVRRKDHRAYYFTPESSVCEPCDGKGRVAGKTARGRKCPACDGTGDPAKRRRMVSVTTALDAILPKPGLVPWSEARGIEGAVEAVRLGLVDPFDPVSAAAAVERVRAGRLGADRARDDAADRGLNVHDCLETYMRTGEPPNPAEHPRAHWGYLRGLTRWLLDADPEPVAVEQLVVHPEDGYAGRYDLKARIAGALAMVDAKTQEKGGIYAAAHLQVNLYERADRRCGGEPAERRFVVVFAADGSYRMMPADHPDESIDAALVYMRAIRPIDSVCERANRAEREARRA